MCDCLYISINPWFLGDTASVCCRWWPFLVSSLFGIGSLPAQRGLLSNLLTSPHVSRTKSNHTGSFISVFEGEYYLENRSDSRLVDEYKVSTHLVLNVVPRGLLRGADLDRDVWHGLIQMLS